MQVFTVFFHFIRLFLTELRAFKVLQHCKLNWSFLTDYDISHKQHWTKLQPTESTRVSNVWDFYPFIEF